MGISVDEMRERVNELYDGNFIRIFEMPEHQVMAIYYQKLNSGAFDEAKRIKKNNKGKSNEQIISEQENYYYQYSIFDYAGKETE